MLHACPYLLTSKNELFSHSCKKMVIDFSLNDSPLALISILLLTGTDPAILKHPSDPCAFDRCTLRVRDPFWHQRMVRNFHPPRPVSPKIRYYQEPWLPVFPSPPSSPGWPATSRDLPTTSRAGIQRCVTSSRPTKANIFIFQYCENL